MSMEDKLTQPMDGARAETEDAPAAKQEELLTELEALRERVAQMEELQAQVAALKEIKAQLEKQVAELRADLLIEQYADRIPPRLRAKWRERAVANYEDTKDLLESMAEYMPKETIEEKAEEPVPEGYLVATSEEQARVYEAFGVKYIRKF